MKILIPAFLALIAISQCATAADTNNQSPYDKNPACLDRNVDSSGGDCIVKDDGTPRHYYPPRANTTTTNSTTPSAPAVSAPHAPAAVLRRGS